MEQFEEKRIVEIVGSLRVCAGGHCTEQDEENTCPWSCGDETCLKKQQEDVANLIESLQAQLTDKTALLDAAIAGQETLQNALNESQRRESAADDLAVSFVENGPYEDANTTALEFSKGIMKLCGPQQAGEGDAEKENRPD